MKAMVKTPVVILLVIGLIAAGIRIWWGPTYQYRYRIGLEVETPQGIRTASSVVEVTQTPGPEKFMGVGSDPPRFKGEAVFLDLGAGKHVVMLIASLEVGFRAFGLENTGAPDVRTPHQLVAQLPPGTKAALKPPYIPTIVTFTDLSDPTSFKIVYSTGYRSGPINGRQPDAEVLVDNFESLFGPSYRFKSATLTIVDKNTPLTNKIRDILPWKNDTKYTRNPGWMELSEELRTIFNLLGHY